MANPSSLDEVIRGLEEAAAIARSGGGVEAVWADLDQVAGDGPWARAIVAVRRLSQEVGVEAAGLLDGLACSAAAEQEAEDAREAALAGPRATARVLAWLPLLGVAIGCALGARPWEATLDRGFGTAATICGIALMVAGRGWTAALLRRASGADGEKADSLLALELLAAALGAGLPIATALTEVGRVCSGRLARRFSRAGARLAQGEPWQRAWAAHPGAKDDDELAAAARRALRLAWDSGVAAGPLLRGAALRERRAARREANVAAGKLAVRLMLPLGLCFLPAFVALGLIPVVMSLASGFTLFS